MLVSPMPASRRRRQRLRPWLAPRGKCQQHRTSQLVGVWQRGHVLLPITAEPIAGRRFVRPEPHRTDDRGYLEADLALSRCALKLIALANKCAPPCGGWRLGPGELSGTIWSGVEEAAVILETAPANAVVTLGLRARGTRGPVPALATAADPPQAPALGPSTLLRRCPKAANVESWATLQHRRGPSYRGASRSSANRWRSTARRSGPIAACPGVTTGSSRSRVWRWRKRMPSIALIRAT